MTTGRINQIAFVQRSTTLRQPPGDSALDGRIAGVLRFASPSPAACCCVRAVRCSLPSASPLFIERTGLLETGRDHLTGGCLRTDPSLFARFGHNHTHRERYKVSMRREVAGRLGAASTTHGLPNLSSPLVSSVEVALHKGSQVVRKLCPYFSQNRLPENNGHSPPLLGGRPRPDPR